MQPIGSPGREMAYKAVSKMAYESPNRAGPPALIISRKSLVGIEKTAYINAVPTPDVNGSVKK
jgi:hypothetical protein